MSVGAITGSAPDVVGAVLGLSEAFKAGKGFAFNSASFALTLRQEAETDENAPASAATAPPSSGTADKASAGSRPSTAGSQGRERIGPVFFEVRIGGAGEGPQSVVELGIHEISVGEQIFGVVELRKLNPEFDESLDSVVVEITVHDVNPGKVLLVLKGFANPGGVGYAHFVGAVLVETSNGATPVLSCRTMFASQAPPFGSGTGIFGKNIEVASAGDRIIVRMYSAPLFSR